MSYEILKDEEKKIAEAMLRYVIAFVKSGKEVVSREEFAKILGVDIDKAKNILRKLWRYGFVRKTRRSRRYKLSLAAKLLIEALLRLEQEKR